MLTVFQLLAQDVDIRPSTGQFVDLTTITIGSIVSALIVLIMVIAAIVFFFMLVIGGIKWIMSGGDKAQAESARNQITAALIGLVIVFAAYAIVNLVSLFFNIDFFNLTFQPAQP